MLPIIVVPVAVPGGIAFAIVEKQLMSTEVVFTKGQLKVVVAIGFGEEKIITPGRVARKHGIDAEC